MIFSEYRGRLEPGAGVVAPPDGRVALSALSSGEAESPAQSTLGFKYVGAGNEIYHYDGRNYAVGPGHLLVVPPGWSGEAAIGRSDAATTEGLCVYLPGTGEEIGPLAPERPVIAPARCSSIGRLIMRYHRLLAGSSGDRARAAARLGPILLDGSEALLEETSRHLERIGSLKQVTRYDLLSRLNKARSHLHDVTDRAVPLAELASVANISGFHLLRHFRDCFGSPPATYHRRIRMDVARRLIVDKKVSCSEAGRRTGFANPSSFSHAFVRVFGHPPGSAGQ